MNYRVTLAVAHLGWDDLSFLVIQLSDRFCLAEGSLAGLAG